MQLNAGISIVLHFTVDLGHCLFSPLFFPPVFSFFFLFCPGDYHSFGKELMTAEKQVTYMYLIKYFLFIIADSVFSFVHFVFCVNEILHNSFPDT